VSRRQIRPRIQADYGVPGTAEGMLPWEGVVSRLRRAQTYWVISINPDGSPQATPVWGTWLGGGAYFSCGDDTHKARNFRGDPRVTIHLDSDQGVVVMSGVAHRVEDLRLERRVTQAMRAKYGESEIPDTAAALHGSYYEVRPTRVLAWANFPSDVTRFEFDENQAATARPASTEKRCRDTGVDRDVEPRGLAEISGR
jgi:PPOX class probable F420-dependent enzyme